MPATLQFLKKSKLLLSLILIMAIGFAVYFYYYYQPITTHAYVVADVIPVKSEISGKIDAIFVRNGQHVKKGQPLFSLNSEALALNLEKAQSALLTAKAESAILIQQKNKDNTLIIYHQKQLIHELSYDVKLAKQQLDMATIKAPTDGIINNLYLLQGQVIEAYQTLFSLTDDSQWWVQANFYETDLRGVKPGQKATISFKLYGGDQVFHGIVDGSNWGISRGVANQPGLLPKVPVDNQWLTMPKRLPVMIKLIDTSDQLPLYPGMSAYVSLD